MAPARSAAATAAPVLALVACCVCIVIVHGPAHGRTELDEAGALRLAEGSGYVKVHRDPTINGADAGVAPHGWAALHEQKALALAEGKLRGDVGGRWHVHHHPHATAGADAAEERALALAEGKLHGDVGGRWHVHHHPHATRGRDAAEERALALAEGEVHGDVGGRWHVHQHPHSIAGSDEHEKRALALAEGKVHPHPYGRAHAAARNGAAEERALRLAEGKEGASARKSIAAGHATAIAKHEEEPVTIQTKWGPLSAANGARQQLLRSIEARPNMHFDKGVSAGEMKTLLARAARMTGAMHEKKESPLVQLNQIQELNAIEKKEAHLQHAMESGSEPARPLGPMGSAHAGDWRRAARGRRAQTLRETLALKLADGPSKPLGMKAHRAVGTARPLVARKMAKGRDLYHTAAFEEEAIAEKKKALAQKQARLKKILARRHEAAKMHQALRGVDVLAHGAQRALGDDMVSVTAIRRGWLGL